MNFLTIKLCGYSATAIAVLTLTWVLLKDTQRPTVTRPPTHVEQQQTRSAMTGWGAAFARK